MFLWCISFVSYLPCLSDSDFQNECLSIFFLSVGARAQVIFFVTKFQRHLDKRGEIEPIYIAWVGRGESVFKVLEFLQFSRVFDSFRSYTVFTILT